MTLRDMKHVQKVLLTLCIFGLITVELRDIGFDVAKADKKRAADRKAEDAHFADISRNQERNFLKVLHENQSAFQETLQRFAALTTVTTQNLNQITGGNTYPYVDPISVTTLGNGKLYAVGVLKTSGAYPLPSTHLNLIGPSNSGRGGLAKHSDYDYGTVYPVLKEIGKPRPLLSLSCESGDNDCTFSAFISAANGSYYESILFRKAAGNWKVGFRVWKTKGAQKTVLRTWTEPGFGKVADWDRQ